MLVEAENVVAWNWVLLTVCFTVKRSSCSYVSSLDSAGPAVEIEDRYAFH